MDAISFNSFIKLIVFSSFLSKYIICIFSCVANIVLRFGNSTKLIILLLPTGIELTLVNSIDEFFFHNIVFFPAEIIFPFFNSNKE